MKRQQRMEILGCLRSSSLEDRSHNAHASASLEYSDTLHMWVYGKCGASVEAPLSGGKHGHRFSWASAHSANATRSDDLDFRNATKADPEWSMLHSASVYSLSRKPVSHFSFLDRLAPSVSMMRTAPSGASRQTQSSLKISKRGNWAAARSSWICTQVWKCLWWQWDEQEQVDDISVSIEVIDINERMICLFLEKSHWQWWDCQKMDNSLIIMTEFEIPFHPLLSLCIWYDLWSMMWLFEVNVLRRKGWHILVCISKQEASLHQSISIVINQFVSKCMPEANPGGFDCVGCSALSSKSSIKGGLVRLDK
jgi:hypothetical protein